MISKNVKYRSAAIRTPWGYIETQKKSMSQNYYFLI